MINNNNIDYTALAVSRLTDQMQQIENQKSRAAIISQIDATIDSIKIEKAKLKDQDTSELDELLYECLMKKKRLRTAMLMKQRNLLQMQNLRLQI